MPIRRDGSKRIHQVSVRGIVNIRRLKTVACRRTIRTPTTPVSLIHSHGKRIVARLNLNDQSCVLIESLFLFWRSIHGLLLLWFFLWTLLLWNFWRCLLLWLVLEDRLLSISRCIVASHFLHGLLSWAGSHWLLRWRWCNRSWSNWGRSNRLRSWATCRIVGGHFRGCFGDWLAHGKGKATLTVGTFICRSRFAWSGTLSISITV
mmetsp:Transcript_10970/g.24153  ORF Transcript_10970/g.24153 Transcript_10970/m.24153 type:complete len:205 (+) Transcript_10970:2362-2976(+)